MWKKYSKHFIVAAIILVAGIAIFMYRKKKMKNQNVNGTKDNGAPTAEETTVSQLDMSAARTDSDKHNIEISQEMLKGGN